MKLTQNNVFFLLLCTLIFFAVSSFPMYLAFATEDNKHAKESYDKQSHEKLSYEKESYAKQLDTEQDTHEKLTHTENNPNATLNQNEQSISVLQEADFFQKKDEIIRNTWYVFESGVEYILLENIIEYNKKDNNENYNERNNESNNEYNNEYNNEKEHHPQTREDNIEHADLSILLSTQQNVNPQPQNQSSHNHVSIEVLKFNPSLFTFHAYTASKAKESPKTISTWHQTHTLLSAINASMFLPDNLTSNGYLRNLDHINNGRIASRLGGFFVAQPKQNLVELPYQTSNPTPNITPNITTDNTTNATTDNKADKKANDKKNDKKNNKAKHSNHIKANLPSVAIIYKDDTDFSRFTLNKDATYTDILEMYDIVIQNFKLLEASDSIKNTMNEESKQWASNKRHSIAAIGEDTDGNILFLFAENPVTIKDFVKIIRHNPLLHLKRALYLDGGKHAGMTLSLKDTFQNWFSSDSLVLMFIGQAKLPNIIGVTKQ